jgi:hypothetical protein
VEKHCDDLDYESGKSKGREDVICPDPRSSYIDPMRQSDLAYMSSSQEEFVFIRHIPIKGSHDCNEATYHRSD